MVSFAIEKNAFHFFSRKRFTTAELVIRYPCDQ